MFSEAGSPDSTLDTSWGTDATFQTAVGDITSINNSFEDSTVASEHLNNSHANETVLYDMSHSSKLTIPNKDKLPSITPIVSDSNFTVHRVPGLNEAIYCPPSSLACSSTDVRQGETNDAILSFNISTPKKNVPTFSHSTSAGPNIHPSASDPASLSWHGLSLEDPGHSASPSFMMQNMGILDQARPECQFFPRYFDEVTAQWSTPPEQSIDIDLQVRAELPQQPLQSVVQESNILFSTFFKIRFEMEIKGTARRSLKTESCFDAEHLQGGCLRDTPCPSTSTKPTPSTPDPPSDSIYNFDVMGLFNSVPQAEPGTVIETVSHQLAIIGDEINERYGSRMDELIRSVGRKKSLFEIFKEVSRALFAGGPTNWGKIVALFFFGYRLALDRIKQGISEAIKKVIESLCDFCNQLNIFSWIARHGGWLVMRYLDATPPSRNSRPPRADELHSEDRAAFNLTDPDFWITRASSLATSENFPKILAIMFAAGSAISLLMFIRGRFR